jgi:hypothetical protein
LYANDRRRDDHADILCGRRADSANLHARVATDFRTTITLRVKTKHGIGVGSNIEGKITYQTGCRSVTRRRNFNAKSDRYLSA